MDVSPRWSIMVKGLVAISILAGLGFLLLRFQVVIAPILMAVILAYLLDPVVSRMIQYLRLPRPLAVFLVFAVLVLFALSLLGGFGFFLQQQLAGLLITIEGILTALPDWFTQVSKQSFTFGPYSFDLASINLTNYQDQILSSIEKSVGNLTDIVTQTASRVAEFFGWLAFILIIAYYLLHDVRAMQSGVLKLVPQSHKKDAERLMEELGPVWNSFLRGQATLGIVIGVIVASVMTILGLRYSIIVGIFAGLMEFIPIIGPYTVVVVEILIAVFQPSNWMGLPPTAFTIGIAVAAIAILQIDANFLSPRIIGGKLRLHPALVIVGAFIGASLAGIPGLLLSSPLLASFRLFGRYIYAKMQDIPPWPDLEEQKPANWRPVPAVTCRPATANDKPAVLDLTSRIWEGHDYIPDVWDDWLVEKDGEFSVAEAEGKVFGLGKLSLLAPGEWWMEGIRVHPDYQGHKIGTRIFQHLLDRWAASGQGVIRLATSSERVQIHHLCQRFSFRLATELLLLTGTPLEKGDSLFEPMPASDAAEAEALADTNEIAKAAAGLVNIGWRWSRLTEARIASFAEKDRAWWWNNRQGMLFLYDDEQEGKPSAEVAAIAAPIAELSAFLEQARRMTGLLGASRLAWTAPNIPGIPEAALHAGMIREWEAALWVFEHSVNPSRLYR